MKKHEISLYINKNLSKCYNLTFTVFMRRPFTSTKMLEHSAPNIPHPQLQQHLYLFPTSQQVNDGVSQAEGD